MGPRTRADCDGGAARPAGRATARADYELTFDGGRVKGNALDQIARDASWFIAWNFAAAKSVGDTRL